MNYGSATAARLKLDFYICGVIINDAYYRRCVYKPRRIYGAIGQLIWNGRRIRELIELTSNTPRPLKQRHEDEDKEIELNIQGEIDLTSLRCCAGLKRLTAPLLITTNFNLLPRKSRGVGRIQTRAVHMLLIKNFLNKDPRTFFRLHTFCRFII